MTIQAFSTEASPPTLIGGSGGVQGIDLSQFAFDAYCATVHAHQDLVLDVLEQALMDAGFKTFRDQGPPVRFYSGNALLLDDKGHRLLSVRSGGSNPFPFVECKGVASPVVSAALREHFSHAPTRIDSSADRAHPDLFARLDRLCRVYERRFGVQLNRAGADPENPDRGSTIYLGSRKSQVFVRVYQKGLKLAEELQLAAADIPDDLRNWVRIEIEFKPQKRLAKRFATTATPLAIWGTSQWTRDFAMEALSIEAERVVVSERRESDHERALRHCATQYRSHLLRLRSECADDAEAFRTLLAYAGALEPA